MNTQLVTAASPRPVLELDLIADFACPWSYLGKRSLERALGNLYGAQVNAMRWHGFTLKPTDRHDPVLWNDHLATRLPQGISVDFAQRSLEEAGRDAGITFHFDQVKRLPDTREAHRLVKLAAADNRQGEVVDALFSSFFEKGRDIEQREVLEDVARTCGLSAETLAAFADPAKGRDDVEAEEKRLRGMGVVTTPNLLINGRVLVPGPADVSTYLQALDQALFPQLTAPAEKGQLH